MRMVRVMFGAVAAGGPGWCVGADWLIDPGKRVRGQTSDEPDASSGPVAVGCGRGARAALPCADSAGARTLARAVAAGAGLDSRAGGCGPGARYAYDRGLGA